MSAHDQGDRLAPLRLEHARLQESMADPALHDDAARARRVGRRYAELDGVLAAAAQLERTAAELETARELVELEDDDEEIAAEAEELAATWLRSASTSMICSPRATPMTCGT